MALADTALVPIGRPFANVRLYVLGRPAAAGAAGRAGRAVHRRGRRVAGLREAGPEPGAVRGGPVSSPVPRPACAGRAIGPGGGPTARWSSSAARTTRSRSAASASSRAKSSRCCASTRWLAEAAVVARERTAGDLRLVAYVVAAAQTAADRPNCGSSWRQRRARLHDPVGLRPLAALPTTTSGKVDRQAGCRSRTGAVAARTPSTSRRARTPEQQLAAIWAEVLDLERVGVHDNFFDLGGNSLLALRLMSRMRSGLLGRPAAGHAVHRADAGRVGRAVVALQAARTPAELPPIEPVPRDGPLPASFAQERFWFVQQLSPGRDHAEHARRPADHRTAGCRTFCGTRSTKSCGATKSLRTSFTMAETGEPRASDRAAAADRTAGRGLSAICRSRSRRERVQPTGGSSRRSSRSTWAEAPLFRVRLLRLSEADTCCW